MAPSGESPDFVQNILESLREKEPRYRGGKDVYDALGNRTMIAIAGATGAGKTTVTEEVIRLDSDFKEVLTTTTRPHREGDPIGFHTGVPYSEFNDAVINANLVNFNVIGDNVYGTYQSGFPGQYNIGPIMTRSVYQLLEAGFKEANVVYMLVEEKEYEERLRRERMDFKDFAPRVVEGIESLEFAEANRHERWLHFVESTSEVDGATKAARKVIEIVNHNTGSFMTEQHALEMIDGMQHALHRVARDVH